MKLSSNIGAVVTRSHWSHGKTGAFVVSALVMALISTLIATQLSAIITRLPIDVSVGRTVAADSPAAQRYLEFKERQLEHMGAGVAEWPVPHSASPRERYLDFKMQQSDQANVRAGSGSTISAAAQQRYVGFKDRQADHADLRATSGTISKQLPARERYAQFKDGLGE